MPLSNVTSEWQRCDLFADLGPTTDVDIGDGGEPVVLDTVGLHRPLNALRALGIGRSIFWGRRRGAPRRVSGHRPWLAAGSYVRSRRSIRLSSPPWLVLTSAMRRRLEIKD